MTHPDHPHEQQRLDDTVHAMLRQIDAWEDRERNVGADLETSLTLADTAEEHAAMLSVHVHEPYFGRLQLHIGGKQQTLYVGRHAFKDLKGDKSVISWESDVGNLFYSNDLSWTTRTGLKGSVKHKRQLDIRRKKILKITDLYQEGNETGQREEVLIERLSEAATTGMRDVVQTLQPEQNEAVRAAPGRHVIIQGAAGSGKTTIGFHRLAWLASSERGEERADVSHCMVLMPNEILAAYSRRILPGLNLGGLTVTTPERWALGFLGIEKMVVQDRTLALLLQDRDRKRRSAAWLKAKALGHLNMYDVIRNAVHERLRRQAEGLGFASELSVGRRNVKVTITAAELGEVLSSVLARDPLEGYRPAFVSALTEEIIRKGELFGHEELVTRQLTPELQALCGKVFMSLLPVSEVRRLLAAPGELERLADGHLSAAQLRAIDSDPLAAMPKSRGSAVEITELPVMLTYHSLINGIGRRDGRQLGVYAELVLDEGQDYAPLLYRLLSRATRPGHLTVLGDLNQGAFSYKGPDRWEEIAQALGEADVINLSRTYRSTQEITALAAKVAATYNRSGHQVVGVKRSGDPIRRAEHAPLAASVAAEVKALLARGYSNVALVTRRISEADALPGLLHHHDVDSYAITSEQQRYTGGVVAIPVQYAKGLEFDACVAVGTDQAGYDESAEYERRLLYITVSRGLHALSLTAEAALHPLLAEDAPVGNAAQVPSSVHDSQALQIQH